MQPKSVVDLANQWDSIFINRQKLPIWDSILSAVIWCLWISRNERVFRAKQKSYLDVATEGLLQGLDWARINTKSCVCRGSLLLPIGDWHQAVG